MRLLFFLLCCLPSLLQSQRGFLAPNATTADSTRRMALVMGNSNYAHTSKLPNPVNDMDSMAYALQQLGFEVITLKDATRIEMGEVFNDFASKINDGRYGVALCFFAGHGLQVNGENFLLPIDANPKREADVEDHCFSANRLLNGMENGRAATKILLLDACRNNPLPRSWRGDSGGGLAFMKAPVGTFIGFATAPGEVALDGTSGRNSPYTAALLRHLRTPGLDLGRIHTRVQQTTQEIARREGGVQVPWQMSSLVGDFYFLGPDTPPEPYDDSINPGSRFGTLKIIPDADCIVWIDGKERASLKSGELGRVYLAAGAHWVECVGVVNNGVKFEHEVWVTLKEETMLRVVLSDDSPVSAASVDNYTDPVVGRFILVKGGTFKMGCTGEQRGCENDEKPVRKVTLSDYYMGETEVTQAQWRAVMGSDPPELEFKGCDVCPVEGVSWDDVQKFINQLNGRRGGARFRLPTEAEWEYAARGGIKSKGYQYSGSKNLDDVASSVYKTQPQPVRSRMPNELSLYDMSGNVWEWCSDRYGAYPSRSESNPSGPSSGSLRVKRGGSRVAQRSFSTPDNRSYDLGFRLARTP